MLKSDKNNIANLIMAVENYMLTRKKRNLVNLVVQQATLEKCRFSLIFSDSCTSLDGHRSEQCMTLSTVLLELTIGPQVSIMHDAEYFVRADNWPKPK